MKKVNTYVFEIAINEHIWKSPFSFFIPGKVSLKSDIKGLEIVNQ